MKTTKILAFIFAATATVAIGQSITLRSTGKLRSDRITSYLPGMTRSSWPMRLALIQPIWITTWTAYPAIQMSRKSSKR